jgi:hypothetical protein
MGSPTGDGAIEALQGKPRLRGFSTGRLTTDAGLPFLQNFPLYRQPPEPANTGETPVGASLLLDGPFTNDGLASLAGLAGIQELDLFWHVSEITAEGFAHLVNLPNLFALGCDGKLSSDGAMGHIAAMPRLRRLRIQESVATDEGFVALSQSPSIDSLSPPCRRCVDSASGSARCPAKRWPRCRGFPRSASLRRSASRIQALSRSAGAHYSSA